MVKAVPIALIVVAAAAEDVTSLPAAFVNVTVSVPSEVAVTPVIPAALTAFAIACETPAKSALVPPVPTVIETVVPSTTISKVSAAVIVYQLIQRQLLITTVAIYPISLKASILLWACQIIPSIIQQPLQAWH